MIVSAPAKDPDLTVVYGVNHHAFQNDKHRFISSASCTTHCLAPLVHVVKKTYGIQKGFFSTIHSYTKDQQLLDSSHQKDFRRARAAGLNIIPTSTGAGTSLPLIFSDLEPVKLHGVAFRVPTANVSVLDLLVETKKSLSLDEVHSTFQEASLQDLKGVLAVEKQALVSSDFIGRTESSILDFPLVQVLGEKHLKLVSWYDNEMGFSTRIVDLVHHIESS